ncbi:MAG: hypothetical protein F6K54_11970 [Okeania sp. SIO3B5]|uniref:hypothetical protein n=1 Tax=Okeania sp. SIO3B5 TaxID=2607811 RepID=UPI001401531E|nr:hypothetical protein [Okeania sp. SIO3B5]NEO53735.1 hypothetical protein [Okeania sp. SIO3B5]
MKNIKVLKKQKSYHSLFIYSILILISACSNTSNISDNPTPTNNSKLETLKFEKKPINDKGGYFYTNGEYALGPFTPTMIKKCREWGGGGSCNSNQWSEKLFLQAYGNRRCPEGATLNKIIGYCVENNQVMGPFPQELISACVKANGGNSCQLNLWNARFLYKLMQDEGIVSKIDKPPQFVMLAFDGSRSLDAWKRSRNFAQEMEKKGINLRFTYFVSAVYFVSKDKRKLYDAPGGKGKGRSDIGWGDTAEDIALRLEQVNLAYQEGHEIGSHAVGHFDGSKWSEKDWSEEFKYFEQFFLGAHKINEFPGSLVFDRTAIEGFRAPLLARSPGLYKVLAKNGFRYDTSKVALSNYWPRKENGIWNFPLASLTNSRGKNVLSMDYNFYYLHSKAKPNPRNAKRYEEDTLKTYIKYFQKNYNGNRAPIDIGHHFSAWNNGAYWRAMFRFAESVCGLPEVRCVTYSELADFMDLLSDEQITAYQQGNFPKSSEDEVAQE